MWKMSIDNFSPLFTTIMAKAIAAAPLSPAIEISFSWFLFILKGAISPKTEIGLAIPNWQYSYYQMYV